MGVRNMQGTPAHIEQLRRKEGEARRYKGRCHHYIDATGQCKLKNYKCTGSANCDEYSRMSDKEFREKQARLRGSGTSSSSRAARRNASATETVYSDRQHFEYKGEGYFFSNGRWLDDSNCFVPDALGRELAAVFEKGKYFYKNSNPAHVSYYTEIDSQTTKSTGERKKAYVKTPSFARGKVDINELANADKMTLARYFGVRSSDYRTDEINCLSLPSRIANRFPHFRIYTVEDLLKLTWEEVLKVRYVGEKHRNVIEECVKDFLENKRILKIQKPVEIQSTVVLHDEQPVTPKTQTQHNAEPKRETVVEEIESVPMDLFQIDDGFDETFFEEDEVNDKAEFEIKDGVDASIKDENEEKSLWINIILAVIVIGTILLFVWTLKQGLW